MAEKLITLAAKGGLANFRSALATLDDKYVVRQLFTEDRALASRTARAATRGSCTCPRARIVSATTRRR